MEWQPIILATVGSLTLLSPSKSLETQTPQEIQLAQNNPVELVEAAYPNRIEIAVNISAHEDLKIAQDMAIAKGQVISDRIPEKTRLQAQKKQLELSLERVLATSIQAPPKPLPVPAVAPLPPVNYLEHEAAIERANIAIALSAEEISIKVQEIEELSQIPDLDPITIEHEQAKLKQLQLNHQIALNELELAQGKLQTAKQAREYQEYLASITAARRVEEENQAKSFYQRQLAEYNEKIAAKEIQVTQLQEKLNDIQSQIENLQIVSPYSGTVRNIEFLGQSEDGSIAVKILLLVKNSEQ
ncbi:MAG: hypothetical protein QNJ55_22475 [Xenococcus sp. MO_188.B8]|nr:hypothetical protein [Xenococcus sp. MO_188.B8]